MPRGGAVPQSPSHISNLTSTTTHLLWWQQNTNKGNWQRKTVHGPAADHSRSDVWPCRCKCGVGHAGTVLVLDLSYARSTPIFGIWICVDMTVARANCLFVFLLDWCMFCDFLMHRIIWENTCYNLLFEKFEEDISFVVDFEWLCRE